MQFELLEGWAPSISEMIICTSFRAGRVQTTTGASTFGRCAPSTSITSYKYLSIEYTSTRDGVSVDRSRQFLQLCIALRPESVVREAQFFYVLSPFWTISKRFTGYQLANEARWSREDWSACRPFLQRASHAGACRSSYPFREGTQ
jgi:hypothetical protein